MRGVCGYIAFYKGIFWDPIYQTSIECPSQSMGYGKRQAIRFLEIGARRFGGTYMEGGGGSKGLDRGHVLMWLCQNGVCRGHFGRTN